MVGGGVKHHLSASYPQSILTPSIPPPIRVEAVDEINFMWQTGSVHNTGAAVTSSSAVYPPNTVILGGGKCHLK